MLFRSCLIVDDGGWIVPTKKEQGNVACDVNDDDIFDIADLVAMQKYINNNGVLADWKAGDLNGDNRIDVFDFCLMRGEFAKIL